MTYQLPEEILYILQTLQEHHKEAYLVGGSVRDLLMNRPVHDYDITTNALPNETMKIFEEAGCKVLPTGLQHGTISVLLSNQTIEITTYRVESDYLNHRAPSSVSFTRNLVDDLSRRDFTINAIAYHPEEGFIDPYQGRTDIENKIIRCVGNAQERMQEDALRILRALRFHTSLNFSIEEQTQTAIRENAHLLPYVSKERIQTEFNKILLSDYPDTLTMLRSYHVLPYILNSYEIIYDVHQHNPWHVYDIFTHTDVALNHSIGYPLASKLAIIFHDIGKVKTQTFDEHGIAHYKKHPLVSTDIAVAVLKDMKYSNAVIEEVRTLILYHDYYVKENRRVLRRFLSHLDNKEDLAQRVLDVQLADDMAKNKERVQEKIDVILSCKKLLKQMTEEDDTMSLKKLAINGRDVQELGYQGAAIGKILQDCLKHVIDHPQDNKREVLLLLIKN